MRESYDSLIRRAIPRYDEMLSTLVDYLPAEPLRVLELGCGTGNLSVSLAQRYPAAALTFVDASEEMIAITTARLAAADRSFAGRAQPALLRFEELRALSGPFDLVVSGISLHHVADKGTLYRDVYDVLAPSGTFRWSDQTRGATEEIHARHWNEWLDYCRKPGNCTPEELDGLLAHAEAHDHYTPLFEHFALLHQAAFAGIDCTWRHNMWVIVTADKLT